MKLDLWRARAGSSSRKNSPARSSGFTIAEIEPRLFSFNAPQGACPACDGLGEKMLFDEDLVVPNHALSIAKGAVVPWAKSQPPSPYYMQVLGILARAYDFDLATPWGELPEEAQQVVLRGTKGKPVTLRFVDGRKSYEVKKAFEGVLGNLERRMASTESAWMREELSRYQASHAVRSVPRRAAQARGAERQDRRRGHFAVGAPLGRGRARLVLGARRAARPAAGARSPARSSRRSTPGSASSTMSGSIISTSTAPAARCRAARASASASPARSAAACRGVLYVLDEPSIGLHQKDNDRLLETLQRLKSLGNTVLVVEHDEDSIRTADHVIDMGPGAGIRGGEVVCAGTLEELLACEDSLTADYLTGRRSHPGAGQAPQGHRQEAHRPQRAAPTICATSPRSIPLGTFTCITGVSGSGKSSFTIDTLYAAAARTLNGARILAGKHDKISGLEHLDKVIDIDQSPIGRTPRSNPATYTGAFTQIRDWFAGLPESQARGYKPGRFSFNVKGGRCEACTGDGLLKIEMHFLPDVYVTCDVCHGQRYNRETLEVKFKGRSIADVLDMTVEDAVEFFKAVPGIRDKMAMLAEVGLGYIKVGQQATTLSGGEAQRVKLCKELSRRATGNTLYILDEPTTGPALRGRAQTARSAPRPGRAGQHRRRDRTQPRRHQDRRLGPRPGPGRRGQRRRDRRGGHAGEGRGRTAELHRAVSRPAARASARPGQRRSGRSHASARPRSSRASKPAK